ncbi:MAG: lipopolysaccharide assembly protein LapA domain-containing protein [Wenzhouxiangellaceae bacterium]
MLRWLLGLCVVAAAVAGILLGSLNPAPALLDFGFWQIEAPLGAIVAGAVVIGVVCGLLLALLLRLIRSGKRSAPGASTLPARDA